MIWYPYGVKAVSFRPFSGCANSVGYHGNILRHARGKQNADAYTFGFRHCFRPRLWELGLRHDHMFAGWFQYGYGDALSGATTRPPPITSTTPA